MAALTDISDIVNRMTGGNSGTPDVYHFTKINNIDGASVASADLPQQNRLWSFWRVEGMPGGGVAPTSTPAACTRTTAGAFGQANPGGGRQKWCVGMSIASTVAGFYYLYDRLAHVGTLAVGSSQDHGGSGATLGLTPTRYTYAQSLAAGNQMFLEVTGQLSTSTNSVTVTYKNQADATSTAPAISIGGSTDRNANVLFPIPLAAGDTGVSSVGRVQVSGTGTTGTIGIVIARPLLTCVIPYAGGGEQRDVIAGLPQPFEVKEDACLALMFLSSGTTAPIVIGSVNMLEK